MTPRSYLPALLLLLIVSSNNRSPAPRPSAPAAHWQCLIVGGGPDRRDNPVALENNIAYVHSLLPADGDVRVLYTNADLAAPDVRVETTLRSGAPWVTYRASQLKHVDGPATLTGFKSTLGDIANRPEDHLLLYFTGHGSPDPGGAFSDNAYDLWNQDLLTVSDLSEAIQRIPSSTPVTLVMVQCFSGAFADAFFAGSQGDHPVVRPASCGFFASTPDREAAGCTPDINQADYRDFTTYFFGALTGRDRVGRAVPSADYDHDGVVEMDEAYAYALGHDQSIDTPTATSDAYVRRFTHVPDREIFQTSYSAVLASASPAQSAALEALSDELKLAGDDRVGRSFAVLGQRLGADEDDQTEAEVEETARWDRFVRLCKTIVLEHEIQKNGPADVREGLNQLLAAEHGRLPLAAPADSQTSASDTALELRDPRGRSASTVSPRQTWHRDCGCTD